jgi:hypothetical protein
MPAPRVLYGVPFDAQAYRRRYVTQARICIFQTLHFHIKCFCPGVLPFRLQAISADVEAQLARLQSQSERNRRLFVLGDIGEAEYLAMRDELARHAEELRSTLLPAAYDVKRHPRAPG